MEGLSLSLGEVKIDEDGIGQCENCEDEEGEVEIRGGPEISVEEHAEECSYVELYGHQCHA